MIGSHHALQAELILQHKHIISFSCHSVFLVGCHLASYSLQAFPPLVIGFNEGELLQQG